MLTSKIVIPQTEGNTKVLAYGSFTSLHPSGAESGLIGCEGNVPMVCNLGPNSSLWLVSVDNKLPRNYTFDPMKLLKLHHSLLGAVIPMQRASTVTGFLEDVFGLIQDYPVGWMMIRRIWSKIVLIAGRNTDRHKADNLGVQMVYNTRKGLAGSDSGTVELPVAQPVMLGPKAYGVAVRAIIGPESIVRDVSGGNWGDDRDLAITAFTQIVAKTTLGDGTLPPIMILD